MIDEFKTNLAYFWSYATTWVAFVASCAFGYWLTLPLADQHAILEAVPLLKYLAPAAGFVCYMAAKGWPQPSLDAKVDASKG